MSFRIETRDHGGRTVYFLHDDATGASASVLPSYGFNLFDLRLPLAGSVRPVLVRVARLRGQSCTPRRKRHSDTVSVPQPDSRRALRFRRENLPVACDQRSQRDPRLRPGCPLGRHRTQGPVRPRCDRRQLPDLEAITRLARCGRPMLCCRSPTAYLAAGCR